MKLWSWQRLENEFKKYPDLKKAFDDHPPKGDCPTFDEVILIDNKQCDIVAQLIGCSYAASMQAQQQEVMAVRKTFWSTPREWIENSEEGIFTPEYNNLIRKITRRYASKKKCHRNWSGMRAGIRCYCDKHTHQTKSSAK